ncbi:MAG: hypothetical protein A2089_07410 [Elusimicrobia bacterium GWD2_63_28]|nr:MAG: hypothetical protein A2089_07410 [Elusimicrobia bacterium GWD2_63_28]
MAGGLAYAENAAYTQLKGSAGTQAQAAPVPFISASKGIYGNNSMQDYYQVPESLKKLADSTVAFIMKDTFEYDAESKRYKVKKALKLTESSYADESEDFSSQNKLADCTGAYVGKGLILTAGHCISKNPKAQTYYGNYFLVFGWKSDRQGSAILDFPAEDVYTIKGPEVYALEGATGDGASNRDFALLSMDREPAGRQALELALDQAPRVGQKVFTIGYPLGLAVKINDPDQAQVYDVEKHLFQTNIDAFGGNSGGPAFDSATNKIIGVVVTAVGAGYSYELKQDISFKLDFTLAPGSSVNVEFKPEQGTIRLIPGLRSRVLKEFRGAGAATVILDENSYRVTLAKGLKIDGRNWAFGIVSDYSGSELFNRGLLVRHDQDTYGTGVSLLPEEIKNLVAPPPAAR